MAGCLSRVPGGAGLAFSESRREPSRGVDLTGS